jgi:hypothetical protein
VHRFFWYERNFAGKYCPAASPDDPTKDGFKAKHKRFGFVTLKDDETELDLRVLAKIYPPPDDEEGGVPTPAPPAPEPEPADDGATVEATEDAEEVEA